MSLFISFEGGEGSGKTTQAGYLYYTLCKKHYRARIVREPGGTPLGEALRSLISMPRSALAGTWRKFPVFPHPNTQLAAKELWLSLLPEAELFLFLASRAQLVAEVIRPLKGRGFILVCDRYMHSTLAYQGYGRGLDLGLLHQLNRMATGGLEPDLTVLLDVEPNRGLQRKRRAQELSRFEQEELVFHRQVREGYLQMAAQDPGRWFVVDASLPKREVRDLIWKRVESLLKGA